MHGLEDGACAVCYPKAEPAAAKAAASPGRVPGTRARSTATRPSRSAPPRQHADSGRRRLEVRSQRVYHLTHVDNLAQIAEHGLVAAGDLPAGQPAVDISSVTTRELRADTPIVAASGSPVAGYVPFFLTPDASLWRSIRAQTPDPRLSAAGRGAKAYDFVMLVSTLGSLYDENPDVVIADNDAAAAVTRFVRGREPGEGMLRTLHSDESEALLRAEVLVPGSVPFERVEVIGVVNEGVRRAVRDALASLGRRTKVAVYPPWFQAA